jgi:hypothetical protein
MFAYLEGLHDQWLREVRGALVPACEAGAGIWLRWWAIDYLETGFQRRFDREQRAVLSLEPQLTAAQTRHLWAAGELMRQLLQSLGHRVGLCQQGEQFSAFGLTLMKALEYWCQQVEETLGRLPWGDVPPESRALFEIITYDEAIQGG